LTLILAFNLLAPIVSALEFILTTINNQTHNLGWSLIALAVIIRAVFWPLNSMQFSSMMKMQAMQPQLKALQEKYKNDQQRLQTEMMALYKANGTNPVAGCLPLVLQLPILWSVYQAIGSNHDAFMQTHFAWIGSPLSDHFPKFLAASLAVPDFALLALYVASMYISVRFSSPPSSDPQQAQTQQMMAIISPLMIAWFGLKWPSGLILFWLTSNIIQTLQQLYLRRSNASAATFDADGAIINSGAARVVSPTRDTAHSSRRPRKGPRRSSR
jgi:YidC/Oxa1 family membrane protein insertase